ncbi:alpha/beta fold hydrolase [Veronia pacifica]|uniref:Serine aminopeptidase S33 domain-containing protein n=1 Tax=Veronia pacifica TaxID=1080227 RepID=A0A1C3E521_9GAMM|nr:alpha/beta fold hydrolase [Veronia pacifica]ODA28342.1 hypothetical protein A8L45_23155 [Veronia pacifica]
MSVQRIDLPDFHQTEIHWNIPDSSPLGLIIFLPALGVSVDYYRDLAKRWSTKGYVIARIESRGMRHSSINNVRKENFGYREVLEIDLATIVPVICQRFEALPFWICGHSLGGQFALLHACNNNHKPSGAILVAAGSNYFNTLTNRFAVAKRYLEITAIKLVNQTLGYFPGHKLGFAGRQPQNLMADWYYEALDGEYSVRNSETDYNTLLKELNLPVLMISMSGDHWVPKSSADALANKLTVADITQIELTPPKGERPFDHFSWVKSPQSVIDTATQWMSDSVT